MQKKNRKGFTLIELLAVIVILAIIALIAVPVIMNVITKARVSAFEDSAYGIVKAGEMYYTNKLLDAEGMTKEQEFTVVNDVFKNTTSDETLDLSGSMPKSGKVKVTTEGKVALAISNGEYCIRKATTESKVKAEKLSDLGNVCEYKTEAATPNPVFTTATGETSIPTCIANNTECTAETIKEGIKVGVKVNDSETKDFYVISDNTDNNEITLIMSENLGGTVAWSDSINEGPVTALAALKDRTSSWTNITTKDYEVSDENNFYTPININAKARFIKYSEATDLGCAVSSGSCPTWLVGNLSNSGAPYGYWTSSVFEHDTKLVWFVGNSAYTGSVYYVGPNNTSGCGIRPVITVSKTIL